MLCNHIQERIYISIPLKRFLDKNFSFDDIDPLGMLESPLASKLKDGSKIKVLQRFLLWSKGAGFVHLLKLLVYIPNNFIFDFSTNFLF